MNKMSTQKTRIQFIRCVDCKAEELDRQGYAVKADIGGWDKPPTIMDMVPDLRAKRGDKVILGKFVRPEELGAVEKEYKKFIDYATRNEDTSFRVYLISEDHEPKLHQIF